MNKRNEATARSGHGEPYLTLQNISKRFGENEVLSNVSFAVEEGEFVSVLGRSGSGKSTLLRIVAGLTVPNTGTVACDNVLYYSADLAVSCPIAERDIGMVFQDFGLWPHLTVLEHVTFPLWSRKRKGRLDDSKREIEAKAMRALEMFQMEAFVKKRPHELSGGQQQRVAFARAVVSRPNLVLLDEAFSALDPQLRSEVRQELVSILREHRMTVLSVTHDQEEAMSISDKILVLQQGLPLQFGTPEEIYERPASRDVATFIGKGRMAAVREANGVVCFEDGQELRLSSAGPARKELANAYLLIRPESLRIERGDDTGAEHVVWRGIIKRQTALIGRTELCVAVDSIGDLLVYDNRRYAAGDVVQLVLQIDRPHLIFES